MVMMMNSVDDKGTAPTSAPNRCDARRMVVQCRKACKVAAMYCEVHGDDRANYLARRSEKAMAYARKEPR